MCGNMKKQSIYACYPYSIICISGLHKALCKTHNLFHNLTKKFPKCLKIITATKSLQKLTESLQKVYRVKKTLQVQCTTKKVYTIHYLFRDFGLNN